jgi:trans-2-enoyl-CoA reductase
VTLAMAVENDLYTTLKLTRDSTKIEVRRAYRNLITKAHPDKGGDPAEFAAIQRAYDVLSDDTKRASYDATGSFEKSVEEELLDQFGGGVFRDKMKAEEARREELAEALVKAQLNKGSHTSEFESWLRARGHDASKVLGVEDMIDRFGVNKGSYEEVILPKIRAYQANVTALSSDPIGSITISSEPIESSLEWGEVLVNVRVAAVNPRDLKLDSSSNTAEGPALKTPYIAGSDCIATVVKVGAGVTSLNEGDWVMPYKPNMGTWRSLAIWKEKDLIKIPVDIVPMEYAAMMREMCVACRILEDFGNLKPGDAVVINAATSVVGQCVIQLCAMLKLRAVAVIRARKDFEKTELWLKSLGASEVIKDEGSIARELERRSLFTKPRLALDAVGGASAVRLAESLQPGCPLIVYGDMGGRAATFPNTAWISNALIVRGFSLRQWMSENKKKVPKMMDMIGKLVRADKLVVAYTDYELSSEFTEALEHACEDGRCTKVLLKVNDIGTTYDAPPTPSSMMSPDEFKSSATFSG